MKIGEGLMKAPGYVLEALAMSADDIEGVQGTVEDGTVKSDQIGNEITDSPEI